MNEDEKNPLDEKQPEGQTTVITGDKLTENKPFKTYTSQKEFDDEAARIRHNAERNAEKEILKSLGLNPEDKAKLNEFKKAYEQTLTEQEKTKLTVNSQEKQIANLTAELQEQKMLVQALCKAGNQNIDDVQKVVKMAKGLLLGDNNISIEQAIEDVMLLVKPQKQATTTTLPVGEPISQPNTVQETQENPFKKETYNLTQQGILLRTNPELAKKLMQDAGVKLLDF